MLLREEDEAVAARFTEVYRRRFELVLNARIARGRPDVAPVALEVAVEGEREPRIVTGDALLFATGRVPNTDQLDVARTGVATDERGYARVDEYLETSVPGIWALGDIVGRYLLKHSANLEAAYATWNILHPDQKAAVDYHAMPHAVFAAPQVGSVGLTEQEARERGIKYDLRLQGHRLRLLDRGRGRVRQGAGRPRDQGDPRLPRPRDRGGDADPGGGQRDAGAADRGRDHPVDLRPPGAAGGRPSRLRGARPVTDRGGDSGSC
jgi:hypothetical protein